MISNLKTVISNYNLLYKNKDSAKHSANQLAVRLLDVVLRGGLLDGKDGVVVVLRVVYPLHELILLRRKNVPLVVFSTKLFTEIN